MVDKAALEIARAQGSVTMNRIFAGVAGVLVFAFAFVHAQAAEPAFAAVSIKPTTLRGFGTVEIKPGGRFIGVKVSVYQLANAAYGITGPGRLIIGPNCPKWIESEKFDVEAVAEEGAIPERLGNAQLRERMQPLIQRFQAERFKLVIHREPKEMPVYELTAAKPGAKLTEAPIHGIQPMAGSHMISTTTSLLCVGESFVVSEDRVP